MALILSIEDDLTLLKPPGRPGTYDRHPMVGRVIFFDKSMERFKTIPARVIHGGHRLSSTADRMVAICDEYLLYRKAGKPQ